MKGFNLVSAVVTATALAVWAMQLALPDGGDASAWRVAGAWLLAALVWAIIYSFIRDGVRATLWGLTRRG